MQPCSYKEVAAKWLQVRLLIVQIFLNSEVTSLQASISLIAAFLRPSWLVNGDETAGRRSVRTAASPSRPHVSPLCLGGGGSSASRRLTAAAHLPVLPVWVLIRSRWPVRTPGLRTPIRRKWLSGGRIAATNYSHLPSPLLFFFFFLPPRAA